MPEKSVKYEVQNRVALITLNEPGSMNVFTSTMKQGLLEAVEMADRDSDVHVAVITGAGKAFHAGGDIKGMGDRTIVESLDKIGEATDVVFRVATMKKPVISAVNGYAMGAGFSLALASDIIIAAEEAKFGVSFVTVGLLPDCGLLHFLPIVVGPWKAKELIFSGGVLTAQEAQQYGIVNRVVEKGKALIEALQYAEQLAAGPVQSMNLAKSVMQSTVNRELVGTMKYEILAQTILQQTNDHKEGISAFKEKRKASFQGN